MIFSAPNMTASQKLNMFSCFEISHTIYGSLSHPVYDAKRCTVDP